MKDVPAGFFADPVCADPVCADPVCAGARAFRSRATWKMNVGRNDAVVYVPLGSDDTARAAVDAFLARQDVSPCLLLAHEDPARLERVADQLVAAFGWSRVEVGRELSAALLAEPPSGYPGQARRWFAGHLTALAPGPALLSGVDLLMEPALDIEPLLLLLRRASRNTRLVVAWRGAYSGGVLSYGVPRRANYRIWPRRACPSASSPRPRRASAPAPRSGPSRPAAGSRVASPSAPLPRPGGGPRVCEGRERHHPGAHRAPLVEALEPGDGVVAPVPVVRPCPGVRLVVVDAHPPQARESPPERQGQSARLP
jgi:hypothetical protein